MILKLKKEIDEINIEEIKKKLFLPNNNTMK